MSALGLADPKRPARSARPRLRDLALRLPTRSQFFDLSTNAPFLIHGIMSRSFSPTCSIGWEASLARVALNEVWLTLFSSIQSRANLPDWMSASTLRISFLVSSVTYSPYSAVLEIE